MLQQFPCSVRFVVQVLNYHIFQFRALFPLLPYDGGLRGVNLGKRFFFCLGGYPLGRKGHLRSLDWVDLSLTYQVIYQRVGSSLCGFSCVILFLVFKTSFWIKMSRNEHRYGYTLRFRWHKFNQISWLKTCQRFGVYPFKQVKSSLHTHQGPILIPASEISKERKPNTQSMQDQRGGLKLWQFHEKLCKQQKRRAKISNKKQNGEK